MKPEPIHAGDGVYLSFDGYHLNIAVNHHTNHVVSIEPAVFRQLVEYGQRVNDEHNTLHFRWNGPRALISPAAETPAG